MNSQAIPALISLVGAILVAGFGYLFTKWREREALWRTERLKHYTKFTESLSGITEGDVTDEGRLRYAKAVNNLNLVAPQSVLTALQNYSSEISISNIGNTNKEQQDKLLSVLYYEIRKDLKISPKDDCATFSVGILSSGTDKLKKLDQQTPKT